MNRAGAWLLGALLAGCSSSKVEGALLALVEFGPGTTAGCIQVVIRTEEGAELRSKPVVTDRTRAMKIGIARNGLPVEVLVYAVGYSDSGCLTPTVPPERTEDGAGTFRAGRTSTVKLTLTRRPNARDDDGDGYASAISGGDDCDDSDPAVHPGADEACADGKDNDCDRGTDCEEAGCGGSACGPISGASCSPPRCVEQRCGDDADNDGDGLRDCADSDCLGLVCRNGGTCQGTACQGASTEKDLCSDGADNDGDQQLDCDDPDCLGSFCDPGTACVTGARCDAAQACVNGVPVSCTSPPSVCQLATGTCDPVDGGCSYLADPGKQCNDGNLCTALDTCSDAGVCAGEVTGCLAIGTCSRATGCAPDAGCTFAPATGDPCDDGDPCTVFDGCLGDAGCGGSLVSCQPNECQVYDQQCSADGGCLFGARDAGLGCDGGVCNGGGACIPVFPYPPSNFTEAQLPTPAGATTLGCRVVIDSRLADGGVGFNGWCGNPAPPFRLVPQPQGSEAVLISFSELEVGLDASVRLEGARPVILAATGNLRVLGELHAGSGDSLCADGGAGGAPGGNKGGGGAGFGAAGAEGGHTGGAGGIVNGEPRLIPLRGGCPGGTGSRGGGGLQLSAAGNLTITGMIAAPGLGGAGGESSGSGGKGGNGAGSGGGLLLEGLLVLVGPTGAVTANGGAGGEGGDFVFDGRPGADGNLASLEVAAGGQSLNGGGRGGNGAAGTTGATAGAGSAFNAAGGGGAGLGRVRINAVSCSVSAAASVSPRPTVNLDAGCP